MSKKNSPLYVTEDQFNGWVKDQHESFITFCTKNPTNHIMPGIDEFHGECVLMNTRNGKTAVAKCRPTDEFNPAYGYGIAWAKYNGVKIPKVYKLIPETDLRPGMKIVDKDNQTAYEFIGKDASDLSKYVVKTEKTDEPYTFFVYSKPKCIFTKGVINLFVRVLDN